MGGLGSTYAVMFHQSCWWRHSWKNRIFPVKTLEIFAWIVPVKLNYESINYETMRGVQGSILPKSDSQWNMRSSPITYFVKEVLGKLFINLINLSKFLAILYHKQTFKEVIFSKAACLSLQLNLKNKLPHTHLS